MLTRCKVAMFIVCKLEFLQSPQASETLVGKMATEWHKEGEAVTKLAGAERVKWPGLFKSLKHNTWGKASVPKSKNARKNHKPDYSKIGYGTVLKKPSRTNGKAGAGGQSDKKKHIPENRGGKAKGEWEWFNNEENSADGWGSTKDWDGGWGSERDDDPGTSTRHAGVIREWGDEWEVDGWDL
jgi:hypothetical protein